MCLCRCVGQHKVERFFGHQPATMGWCLPSGMADTGGRGVSDVHITKNKGTRIRSLHCAVLVSHLPQMQRVLFPSLFSASPGD